jgi:uncharacterized FAD-dependent dehydrogenase
MQHDITLSLPPEVALDDIAFRNHVLKYLSIPDTESAIVRKTRQSIDARSRQIVVNVAVSVFVDELALPPVTYQPHYQDVSAKPVVVIVGCGPAGMFAALRLIELGFKPIILERGKDVRARRRDLAAINKAHVVNGESNYCFGEGGAGTYSDGKLYTRSTKRGDVRRILEILVAFGATEQILYDAHPHIGTNKLPALVASIREAIINAGGEVHFNTKVVDFVMTDNEIKGVITESGQEFIGIGTILATGHSARDIFELCQQKAILIEAKPFALGVRIEHQQATIDEIQYKTAHRGLLPASSYSLVGQTHFGGIKRGVFSFCMCPGGFIVPSATAPGELVVNGMSPSRRDSRFANSGMVVAVEPVDLESFKQFGALAGLELQKQIEQRACATVGGSQTAPAQRVLDFVNKKTSNSLLDTSYQPGLQSLDLREYLPAHIAEPLRDGLQQFGQKMKGYLSNDAQLIGVESRTSSPVRIPRHKDTGEHLHTQRLYPCAEGAGYAGGIMSAALDGTFVAEQLVLKYGQ